MNTIDRSQTAGAGLFQSRQLGRPLTRTDYHPAIQVAQVEIESA